MSRGRLLVVATPLGNLDDLSPRAVEALRDADLVACEDTRRTATLLSRHALKTPTVSCHKFNESRRLESLLARLGAGESIVLVSDGGTPAISDPGSRFVAAALAAGVEVVPIPGPSAVTTLLSVCGFPADRYVFEGFLPHRGGERRRRLRELRRETRTVVVFEAPHRILDTLTDIAAIFGGRGLVLGRELTKLHETLLRGSAAEIRDALGATIRSEISIAIAGADENEALERTDPESRRLLDAWQAAGAGRDGDQRAALRETARSLGIKRAELYRRLVELGALERAP